MRTTVPHSLENTGTRHTIHGVPEGQDARILAQKARVLAAQDRILIHVALDDTRIAILTELLAFFAPEAAVAAFPAWDCLPYDRISPGPETSAQRVSTLSLLLRWQKERERRPRILLTGVNAALQRVMPADALRNAGFSAKIRERLDRARLDTYLRENGYIRADTVRVHGEYAMRGGIIDIFPAGFENPVRLDLFGDDIESIREFDPATQRTQAKLETFELRPAVEFFLNEGSIARFRSGYREAFGPSKGNDPLYEAVSEGRRYNGMDHWQPLFFEHMDTLFDYAPGAGITFDHHAQDSHTERLVQIRDFYETRRALRDAAAAKNTSGGMYHPLPAPLLYLQEAEWTIRTGNAEILSPFRSPHAEGGEEATKGRDFSDIRALPDGDVFGELKKHIGYLARPVLIACATEGAKARLTGLMDHAGIGPMKDCGAYEDIKRLKPGQTGVGILPLEHGFVAPDLAIITESDILGDRLARAGKKRRKAGNFLTEISALAEGDYVVHTDHGIGKFIALETLKAGKTLHDCLKIEYAGGDRLYVPVENIEVLSRFGSGEGAVQLDKLGGAGWQVRKARVKKNLMEMAEGLLEIAAARMLGRAETLDIPADLYNEFAARFPYQETEDQERAIQEVLAGLAGEYPMDRLVCGDVGFGKTEVAMRAAYVAAMDGAQVAVAVPTTLLARQHYRNFTQRFAGTGLRIAQLSRMVSPKEAEDVKKGLSDGSVNIVIGTHALFAKDIKFTNLALLIVDEEQRFGVKQKERLKELRTNVHILTLTATPIPRTLQMSLTGVKEMSLIATPPVDRLAVRTFVLPFDSMVIREALLREHYRGGQSFYVCPRIKDMQEIEAELKELVPELKLVSAHGQMTPADLEDRMSAFYDGQYDILLATNIIESGIDIPRANTMIVHRADMFGLAQLYQIRGRIGRSKVRAYAYLTWAPQARLSPQAQKRLEVMETLDTLGSGFQLASHDMDIRGAGNLLGDQQSGHIREVGAELYQQMLEDAVAAARAGAGLAEVQNDRWSPQINLGTSVLIPEDYVEDLSVRMGLYRRLADLANPPSLAPQGRDIHRENFSAELESFAAELIDRFGPLPAEVTNLLDIVSIKQLCKISGVVSVEGGPKGAVIGFYNDSPSNVPALLTWIQKKGGSIKLRADQKLVLIRQWDTPGQRVKGVRALMAELAATQIEG